MMADFKLPNDIHFDQSKVTTPAAELPPDLQARLLQAHTRRHFLGTCATGLGALFLGTMTGKSAAVASTANLAAGGEPRLDFTRDPGRPLSPLPPQFAPKARRVIYLHMAGAPSQLELFEHKPELTKFDGKDCPASFLAGKRFAFISGIPKLLGSQYPFHQAGQSGAWLSDRLPYLERHIDDLCFIRSMHTDQFNHAPAQLLVQTGNARLGYASFGSWVTYGLGTENQNLPGFIVLLSGGKSPDGGKELWGSGFLPSVYQGVQCRSHGEPVLYLNNPPGVSRPLRRRMLDAIDEVNQQTHAEFGNPDAFFDTKLYQALYADTHGIDPLRQFDESGWKAGRLPSLGFDGNAYLAANPDVVPFGFNPLTHFLTNGHEENRLPIAAAPPITADGFDYLYYLNRNPDVAAAGLDAYQHFETTGWKEGRNPNAYFDTSGYLAHYADVAAAHLNPFDHYNQVGWKEGRDPSVNFDTSDYLAHYVDVAAAHVNPLVHFLQHGQFEGRSGFADGVWG